MTFPAGLGPETYSLEEAAEILGMGKGELKRLATFGVIPGVVRNGKDVRIKRAIVDGMVRAKKRS